MSEKMLEVMNQIFIDEGVEFDFQLTGETKLKEDLLLGDDGIEDVVIVLEDKYDIIISDDACESMNTVGDLIKIVESSFS
jgi:acyl carrier protein